MSKIAKSVVGKIIGAPTAIMEVVQPVYEPHYDAFGPGGAAGTYVTYRVGLRVGVDYTVDSTQLDDRTLQEIKQSLVHQLVNDVFGEFRPTLYALQTALYQRDFNKCRDLVRSLETEMFSVETINNK